MQFLTVGKIKVKNEQEVKEAEVIAANEDEDATILAQHEGRVEVKGKTVRISYDQVESEEFEIPSMLRMVVKNGDKIEAGQALTERFFESAYNPADQGT